MEVAGRSFDAVYKDLEQRMKALAEADGDVFLPNPQPVAPVEYILICMEPSLGRWARSPDHAQSRVEAGFRNFLTSIEDFILHFSVRRYLCQRGQRYHVTDLSKGAMLVERAGVARAERYDRWYALLLEEIDLCATPDAGIIAVGNAVARQLERRGFQRPFSTILHYSRLAAAARAAGIVGYEGDFEAYKDSISLEDILATAEDVFSDAGAPDELRDETLSRLAKGRLTPSLRQLAFNYKIAFEMMRSMRCGAA